MISMAVHSLHPDVRLVTPAQASEWLNAGWRDVWRNPLLSLGFGALYAGIGLTLFVVLNALGMGSLLFAMAAGFMLVGPLAAVFLYEISRRTETGEPISLGLVLGGVKSRLDQIGNMGLVLSILLMAWLLAGLVVFALFYPPGMPLPLGNFIEDVVLRPESFRFLMVGTLVGGALAVIAFSISVFAMPMLLDRDVGVMEAMEFSVYAVRVNWRTMIGWAATIAVVTFFGMATAFVGMIVALPVVAHASWHAYRDVMGRH
ncbi:putative integral membrane protein [Paramagnetospirillum magnetotacticum MS-1]|uniref:Putative integral membrane protein n=1 Tax=Paramagnetospirillum magnetotacticum MS-1 TaxID=272627 RepID=A0A0C2V024_PARME|nr:DUF2189 domain-containing protein [Paramagnetospirillum magnetotacticum]KIL98446.1 putative integral membrane protein [Paramagnetospirillum magnetotacticum MS-1]